MPNYVLKSIIHYAGDERPTTTFKNFDHYGHAMHAFDRAMEELHEEIAVFDWHLTVYFHDSAQVILETSMDDMQMEYDHRTATVTTGFFEHRGLRDQPVPEGQMVIGWRDNLDATLHRRIKLAVPKPKPLSAVGRKVQCCACHLPFYTLNRTTLTCPRCHTGQ